MRWKAFYFLNSDSDSESDVSSSNSESSDIPSEKYGLKSKRTPPVIDELTSFENDLLDMVDNIEFQQVNDDFQYTLKQDVKNIASSDKLLVKADKTRNMYEMKVTDYDKLLTNNITKTYKPAEPDTVSEINTEFGQIANELGSTTELTIQQKKLPSLQSKTTSKTSAMILNAVLLTPQNLRWGALVKWSWTESITPSVQKLRSTSGQAQHPSWNGSKSYVTKESWHSYNLI